jgi:hypothetical protein
MSKFTCTVCTVFAYSFNDLKVVFSDRFSSDLTQSVIVSVRIIKCVYACVHVHFCTSPNLRETFKYYLLLVTSVDLHLIYK